MQLVTLTAVYGVVTVLGGDIDLQVGCLSLPKSLLPCPGFDDKELPGGPMCAGQSKLSIFVCRHSCTRLPTLVPGPVSRPQVGFRVHAIEAGSEAFSKYA
jgi:hypothetical protein